MVICLERGADRLAFLVPAHLGSPRKRAVKRVHVCCSISEYDFILEITWDLVNRSTYLTNIRISR